MNREMFISAWAPTTSEVEKRRFRLDLAKVIDNYIKQYKEGIAAVIYDLEQLSCKED